MLVFQDESLVPIGYTDSDFFSQIESPESLPLDMWSPLEVESLVRGV